MPLACGSYRCGICLPAKIAERVRIAAWGAAKAETVRLLTLTQIPGSWQQARNQVKDFVRRLRKHFALELAWSIEENPKGTGYHAHALQHGEYMQKERVRKMWGGRFIDIRRVEREATGYLAKCQQIAGYQSKSTDHHLLINGGRAIHLTRGYLHGLTSREVLREMSQGKKWHLVRATMDEIRNTGAEGDDSREDDE
jgi:hypothetical protein